MNDYSTYDSQTLRRMLKDTRARFNAAGGRGVYEAEEIDSIRKELRARASRKGWLTRKQKNA